MLDALPLPHSLESRIGTALLRRATVGDTDAVIALLADDPISAARGDVASAEDSSRSWPSRRTTCSWSSSTA